MVGWREERGEKKKEEEEEEKGKKGGGRKRGLGRLFLLILFLCFWKCACVSVEWTKIVESELPRKKRRCLAPAD